AGDSTGPPSNTPFSSMARAWSRNAWGSMRGSSGWSAYHPTSTSASAASAAGGRGPIGRSSTAIASWRGVGSSRCSGETGATGASSISAASARRTSARTSLHASPSSGGPAWALDQRRDHRCSGYLGHKLVRGCRRGGIGGFPLRRVCLLTWRRLVPDMLEEVRDDVQPRPPLVVRVGDIPRRPRSVGGLEHGVAGAGIVVPPGVRLEIHRRELPQLAAALDPVLEPFRLLGLRHLQPVLEQDDPGVDHHLLDQRRDPEECLDLLLAAEAHHTLDPGAVVPAAVEDHDFARRRQVRDIALRVHLRFVALGRGRERGHPEHARADPFGDRLDGAALAGAIPSLEHDADLEPLVLHPLLEPHELDVQLPQLPLVVLPLQLFRGASTSIACVLVALSRGFRRSGVVVAAPSVSFHADLLAGSRPCLTSRPGSSGSGSSAECPRRAA